MNKITLLKDLYKPYRYTLKGKCTIIETTSGKFVIKKNNDNKDLEKIFNYLESRDYNYFPKVLKENRDKEYIYEYIEEDDVYNPQKSEDLIDLVGLLHVKTSYSKEVSEEDYKTIYEDINNNIMYLKDYYLKHYELFLKEIYPSPSHYEYLRNYSKINSALDYSQEKLDNWYELVKEKKQERISLVHNNLSLNHYIKKDKGYLISWDHAKFDTPIIDLVKLYKNNYWDLEFKTIYEKYLKINPLNKEEELLFFILISLVPEISFDENEFLSCKNMREKIDYIYKTEEFLKPYNTTNSEYK